MVVCERSLTVGVCVRLTRWVAGPMFVLMVLVVS